MSFGGIFIRIYGGILLALICVCLFIYGSLFKINEYRASEYRENMARSTMWLVANGSLRYPPETRQTWLDFNSKMLEMHFSIDACEHLTLNKAAKKRLNKTGIVIRFDERKEKATAIYRIPHQSIMANAKALVQEENNAAMPQECLVSPIKNVFSDAVARATVVLILDVLGKSPGQDWEETLQEIQPHFDYPLAISVLTDLSLSESQVARLQKKEVVTSIGDTNKVGGDIWVYSLIGHSQKVLRLGPIKLFDKMPTRFLVWAGLFGLLFMTVVSYWLVRTLQKRLRSMKQVINKMGHGHLSTRMTIQGRDDIAQLGYAFNGMADHIQRLVESQREMVRAVSHELRTPVARIRFGLEMLVEQGDEQKREHQVAAMDDDIEQLNTLIDEILTYARLEQGTPRIEFKSMNVVSIIDDIIVELQPLFESCRFVFDKQDEAGGLREVWSDIHPVYWQRAAQNLISNASKYGKGLVHIKVAVKRNNRAYLIVEDNGDGIPEENRETIFEPFARLDASRTRDTGGYGLGLSIVKRIAEWHGGDIKVETSPAHKGARFVLAWQLKHKDMFSSDRS